jgi:hypothetical protein
VAYAAVQLPGKAVGDSAVGDPAVGKTHAGKSGRQPLTAGASTPSAHPTGENPVSGQAVNGSATPSDSAGAALDARDSSNNSLPRAQRKALALGMRYLYPDLTDEEIAQAAGVSRRTLFRWEEYNTLKKAQRELWRPPHGHKDADGNLEAWEDEDE